MFRHVFFCIIIKLIEKSILQKKLMKYLIFWGAIRSFLMPFFSSILCPLAKLCVFNWFYEWNKKVPSLHYILSSSRMNQICSKTKGFSMSFTFCLCYYFMLMIVPYIKQATFRSEMCVRRQGTFRIKFCH